MIIHTASMYDQSLNPLLIFLSTLLSLYCHQPFASESNHLWPYLQKGDDVITRYNHGNVEILSKIG